MEYQRRKSESAPLRAVNGKFHKHEAKRKTLALEIWKSTVPANGTLVERYLAERGITLPLPNRLRFHRALAHRPSGTTAPAMVALVTGVDDKPAAVHRTYLNRDGRGQG
jgi:hypothetical protein